MSYIKQKEARVCHKYIFPEYSNSGSAEWSRPDLAELVYTQSRRGKRAQPRCLEAPTTSAGMSRWDPAAPDRAGGQQKLLKAGRASWMAMGPSACAHPDIPPYSSQGQGAVFG